MRRLPPLNSLKAFEAVARLGGVVAAAEELCVSHGAVSKQLLNLERWLGVPLFDRSARRLAITEPGRVLLLEIGESLDKMAAAISRVVPSGASKKLVVSVPPTLTLHWLVPRLTAFVRQHPDIRIQLNNRRDREKGLPSGVDVAIRRGRTGNSLLAETMFMNEAITPLCAPGLTTGSATFDDLAACTWLMADMRPNDWAQWLEFAKTSDLVGAATLSFDHTYLAIEAALDGMGVAMGPRYLMQDEIESGRLRPLFRDLLAPSAPYFFVCDKVREGDESIAAFRTWLQAEGSAHALRVFSYEN